MVVQEGVQRVFSSFTEALRRESMRVEAPLPGMGGGGGGSRRGSVVRGVSDMFSLIYLFILSSVCFYESKYEHYDKNLLIFCKL